MGDKKKFRLNTSNEEVPLMFGILTDARDYKITWLLNQTLKINLKRTDDLIWMHKSSPSKQHFANYIDAETSLGHIQLIHNISSENIRMPKYKQLDYLLIIKSTTELLEEANWISTLRASSEIRGIYKMDYQGIQDLLG